MNFFLLEKELGTAMKNLHMLRNNLLRIVMTLLNDTVNLTVNCLGNILAVTAGVRQISSNKYLIVIISIGDQSNLIGHTILGHHSSCFAGSPLDIVGCTSCNIAENQLLQEVW